MTLRICRGLLDVLLLSSIVLAACGDDDVVPPPGVDMGHADAGPRDALVDAPALDATRCADDDGDGRGAAPCSDDCDDADATRYPGATEICDTDDEDCDDTTYGADVDADGFESSACCNGVDNCGSDCDDALSTVSPTGAEVCDGLDDDCDGSVDEAVCIDECALGTPCGAGLGTCTDTFTGYTCACIAGYGAPAVGGPCADIDECALGTDDCDDDPDACVNRAGDFTCTCPADFLGTARGASGCIPHFVDLGNGTVRDNATALVWQQGFSPATQDRAGAIAYCAGLALAGTGWRLPTVDELWSLVDTRFTPTIDASFFPGTPYMSEFFWTISPSATTPGEGWQVGFYLGTRFTTPFISYDRARCVR